MSAMAIEKLQIQSSNVQMKKEIILAWDKEQIEELEEAREIGKGLVEEIQKALYSTDKQDKKPFEEWIGEWKAIAAEVKSKTDEDN